MTRFLGTVLYTVCILALMSLAFTIGQIVADFSTCAP